MGESERNETKPTGLRRFVSCDSVLDEPGLPAGWRMWRSEKDCRGSV